jgi:hypothetical protein
MYHQRVGQLGDDPAGLAVLRHQERDWIKQRDQQCGQDAACLTQATKAHADYLAEQVRQNDSNVKVGASIPPELLGKWTVRKVFPITGITCWADKEAKAVLGTTLEYRQDGFFWKDKSIRNLGSETTTLTAKQFAEDNAGGSGGGSMTFGQLGITAQQIKQVMISHPDVSVYPASADCCASVPGVTVLFKGPDAILFSLCGIFYEADRN